MARYQSESNGDGMYVIVDVALPAGRQVMQADEVALLLNAFPYPAPPATITEQLKRIRRELCGLSIGMIQLAQTHWAIGALDAAHGVLKLQRSLECKPVGDHAPFPMAGAQD